MQSTITNIEAKGPWTGQYGTMYSFKVTFQNNETLEVNSKTELPPYEVGDVVDYEVTKAGKFGKQGKIKKAETISNPVSGNDIDRQLLIVRQSCLKAAVECNPSGDPANIILRAEIFTQWVMTGVYGQETNNEQPF